jgi:sugar lactone lactonase YvrE
MSKRNKKTPLFLKLSICGWTLMASNLLMSQAPLVKYPAKKILTLDSVFDQIVPSNIGGTVPKEIYGNTSTYTGSRAAGLVNGFINKARFNQPSKIIIDEQGNLYVSEEGNNVIRKISTEGIVSTFAGSGKEGKENNSRGTMASFHGPSGMAFDKKGNLFVADIFNHQIRKISPIGEVSVYAGNGKQGFVNASIALNASFAFPVALAMDDAENLLVVDEGNHAIRKISKQGVVSSLAGSGIAGFHDDANGLKASFNQPNGIAIDATGNIFIADQLNHRIRKINREGAVSSFAGSGIAGSADNVEGALANFNHPRTIAIDKIGNLYVGDVANNKIRKITANGIVTTLAGTGAPGSQDDSLGLRAGFNFPNGITIDASGKLYIADQLNNKIRTIETNGYFISPELLPKGIEFNQRTGVFSGKAMEAAAHKQFSVWAYNTMGSSVSNISFTISPQPGNALSFDGFDDRVVIQDAECLNPKTVTVELWVNVKKNNGSYGRIILKRNDQPSYDDSYSIGVDSSLHFYSSTCLGDGKLEGQRMARSKNKLVQGKWYYVAAVFRSDTMKIYVNGILQDAVYTGFPLSRGRSGLYLGFDERLAFEVDEVRIFNTDRTKKIPEDMFQLLPVATADLVAYYNFNTGHSGGDNTWQTTLVDISGNNNDGTLVNFKSLTGSTSNWVESYALMIPQALEASEIASNSFVANWKASRLGIVEEYLFDLSEDSSFKTFVAGYQNLKIKEPSIKVQSLQPGRTYYYRVSAEKKSVSGQGGYSNTITVKTANQ